MSEREEQQAWADTAGPPNAPGDTPGPGLFRQVVDALPLATLVLDRFGIVAAANAAWCELLQLREDGCVGEPLLTWIGRSSEREAFGRAFMSLRGREVGATFAVDLTLVPALGPATQVLARACRLTAGQVVVSCEAAGVTTEAPEAELGRAVTRSLDALDQGVLLIDGEGRIVHANPAARDLLGEAVVGRSFLSLADPGAVEDLSRALALGRAGGWQGEVELRRVDGEPVPMELSLAVGAGDGAPGVVLLRDLRERRRRAFEERLVAQIDRQLATSPEPRDAVLAACVALARGLGAHSVAVLARVGGGWERWVVRKEEASSIEQLGGEGEPPASWSASGGFVEVRPGDPAVERWFGSVARGASGGRVPLRTPGGVVGHLLLVRPDPVAWSPRDRALMGTLASQISLGLSNGMLTLETRALAAYQAMILNQTSVLIDSVDAEGRLVTWNRASEQLLGYAAGEALGRRLGVEVAATPDPAAWARIWQTLVAEGVFSTEISLCARDGKEIPLHLEGRLLREDDAVRGAVLVGLDLRERRALEGQVLRSQKLAAVGLLAAGIAHEINNPLSGVVGYSRLLLDRRDLREDIREKVEKIAQSGERCRKIVKGVLLFSRTQDGGTRGDVDLRTLLDRVVAIGEYQWRMHNVRILREANEPVTVHGDVDQLEQVILNLLANAVDAMPRGGSVRVDLRRSADDGAILTVTDEGPGIPAEVQSRIFDPFFSTKEIGKGTGLGLAISYGIVEDHGGDIVVESAPAAGATFTVRLPKDGRPSRSVKEPSESETTSTPDRVSSADDSAPDPGPN